MKPTAVLVALALASAGSGVSEEHWWPAFDGSVRSIVTFIPYGDATWRITGTAPARTANQYLGRTLLTARSFAPLSEADRRSVISMRMRIETARPGEDLATFARRVDDAWDLGVAAVYNGIFTSHRFEGGERVKITHAERYIPPPRPAIRAR